MILTGLSLAHALVLQAGQTGQHVDGGLNVFAVQVTGQDDLSLGDIARQVGDGVGLVVLRHGQNGDHGHGTGAAQLAARPLIHGGKVRIQVAGIAAAAGDLLPGGGYLPQRLGVVGDIRQDHQHVHSLFKGQILGGGEGHTGRGDTFHGRVVGQIGEQHRPVDGAGAAELGDEVLRLLEGDADGGEHHGEGGGVIQHLGLPGDLSRQPGVGQTGSGENGQLLATHQRIQTVDGGDARLDELIGVVTGGGIHRQTVDVQILLRQQSGAAVDGLAHAVKDTAQHIFGHCQLQGMPQKTDLGVPQVDAGGVFKQLHHGPVAVDLQHLASAQSAVGQLDLRQLVIGDALYLIHHHQRSVDLPDGAIFLHHCSSPAFRSSSRIWLCRSASILS